MQYTTAEAGRVFILRLEEGEVLHEVLEAFASAQGIHAAAVIAVGGAGRASRLVVGPVDGAARPVVPMEHVLEDVHEIAGVGTIFPDEAGRPVLHMHIAGGRGRSAVAGCVRRGVKIWQVLEVVVQELLHADAMRRFNSESGFQLLECGER